MKSAQSKILVGDASGVRAPYAVRSLLRAGPKWKFVSITLREVGRQPNAQAELRGLMISGRAAVSFSLLLGGVINILSHHQLTG